MEKSIKHLEHYFGAHEISVKNYLPPCSSGVGAGSCPSCSTWVCCAWPQPGGGTGWQQDTEVLQTLPILAGSAETELRKNLTYLLLRKKKQDFSCNERTAFRQASQRASPPRRLCPLLPPPRPSREPAKPFRGGLSSMPSRSTSAPRPSRTALQHWKLCRFHLGFHYLSPQMSAAVAAPAGGLRQDCGLLPAAPLPEVSLRTPVCAGARCHRGVTAAPTRRGL